MQSGMALAATDRLAGLASWLGVSDRSRGWRGYLNAGVALALTVAIRAALGVVLEAGTPTYLIFLAPVFVAALFGGVMPALVTTAVALGICHFFFVEPTFTFKGDSQDWVIGGVFLVEGAAISLLGGQLRHTVAALVRRERQLAANEARLLMAQQAARIATYEWSPETGDTVWSENAEEIMAMEPGTLGGKFHDATSTVLEEDRALLDSAAKDLLSEGSNEVDYRIAGPGGEVRWLHATGTVVRYDRPEPDRVVGVIMDISERRLAAELDRFLAAATVQLGRSMDYQSNVAGLAEVAVPQFCEIAAVVLVRDGRFPGEVVALRHANPARESLTRYLQAVLEEAPEHPGLLARAIRSGTPLFMSSIAPEQLRESAISDRHREAVAALNLSAAMCIPLSARGRTLGGLVFAHDGGRSFSPEDYTMALEIGRRASIAIENGLLLEQSFEREAEVSRKNEALQLIADAGVELSASLDLSETLESLARLVVPRFADVCTIALDEGGRLEPVALAASTPELYAAMKSLSGVTVPDRELSETAAQVLRSDRPIFFPQIPADLFERIVPTEEHSSVLGRTEICSAIIMPLSARGQTLGVMTFLRTKASPEFDREDLSLAGQISRRTAVSADNGRLYAEARRANDAKDEFLGMMSHELRTPITVIHGGARVLRSRGANLDDETREGLLGDIERESDRLSRMLENLLALARAELDREVILEPVLLQRLLPRLLSTLETTTGRDVSLETLAEVPAVSAEPGYIEHIVRNLVSNAVKYSPPNAPIEVCLAPWRDGASVCVLDRGFGIAPEESSRIFERFYRSDRTSRLAGGAGLGLAVCKRLVEAMSGEIWASPREGGGLEVGFGLPPYQEENIEL